MPVATITASGTTTFCQGGSVTLTSSTGSSYLWSTGATTASISPTTAGNFTVQVTDVNGCKATSQPVVIKINSLPTVIANTSKTIVCLGDNVTLSGEGATTYLWDNNVSNGVSFVPGVTKTYTVTGTDVNGCTKTATISVVVNSLPSVIANTSKTSVCSGDNVTLTGAGASTYAWDNNVSNGVSFVPATTKTYIVTGTDVNGCTKTASISVAVNSLPSVITNTSKTSVCSGDNVTLTGAGASTYAWDNNVSNGVSFVPATTKTYTVTGTDVNGCTKTASISVTVNSLPNLVISSNGNTTSCKDGGLELLTSNIGTSYLWSSGETTSNIYPTQSGVYSLKFKDVNGCEGLSNSIKVTINPLPIVTVTTNGPITYCTTKLTELVASNGVSYLWNDGSTTKTIKPTQSGSYFVKVTDINGCSANSELINVTVNDCAGLDNLSSMNIRVFPNPTSDKFMVSLPENLGLIDLKLYDNAGKLVKIITNMEKETSISVDDLAEGIYTVKLFGNNLFYITKVTITK